MVPRLFLRFCAVFLGAEWYAKRIGVTIGSGCRIYTTHFGSEPFLIRIGNRVTVTSGVRFVTHDGSTWLVRDGDGRRFRFAPINVGSDVFLGVNTIVLPGVSIGDQCVIGAGSVITQSIPSGSIAAGVPARVIGDFNTFRERVLGTAPSERDLPDRRDLSYEKWVRACIAADQATRT